MLLFNVLHSTMETKPRETSSFTKIPSRDLISSRTQCKDVHDLATGVYFSPAARDASEAVRLELSAASFILFD